MRAGGAAKADISVHLGKGWKGGEQGSGVGPTSLHCSNAELVEEEEEKI